MKQEFIIIKTTYPQLNEAKKMAKILLNKKLAACVQFSKIDSLFNWNHKITSQKEILVTIKTKEKLYKKVQKEILANHSYKIPQIFAIKMKVEYREYLDWIDLSTDL